jgi:hypothetical protein
MFPLLLSPELSSFFSGVQVCCILTDHALPHRLHPSSSYNASSPSLASACPRRAGHGRLGHHLILICRVPLAAARERISMRRLEAWIRLKARARDAWRSGSELSEAGAGGLAARPRGALMSPTANNCKTPPRWDCNY